MAEIKDPENTIILETTKGKVVIQLLPQVAPEHVARIKELAREKAYDGVVYPRSIVGNYARTINPLQRRARDTSPPPGSRSRPRCR